MRKLQTGDVFFTSGGGVIGRLIRLFSSSPVAHTGMVVGVYPDGHIKTHEAFWPSGVKEYERKDPRTMNIQRVYRVTDDRNMQYQMLLRSNELVGKKYDLFEIFRIMNWGVNEYLSRPVFFLLFVALGLFVNIAFIGVYGATLAVTFLFKKLLSNDNPDRFICSNHIAEVVKAGRPSIEFSYPTTMIWPGKLELDIHLSRWEF